MGEPTVVFIAGKRCKLTRNTAASSWWWRRNDPKELVEWTQSGLRMLAFQDCELLAEGKIL
jgi:hypothetical protein